MLNYARFYSSLGMNVIPCNFKFPKVLWNQYSLTPIPAPLSFDWDNNAIACINGVNDFVCFDFDKADLSHIENILSLLQLPFDYPWTVASGSGVGFHIWFRFMRSDSFVNKFGDKAVLSFYPKNKSLCHHAELRLKSCYTILPPSSHLSGLAYSFNFKEPSELPPYISEDVVFNFLAKTFTFSPAKVLNSLSASGSSVVLSDFDSSRLSSAVSFLSENLGPNCYSTWNKLGLALCSLGKDGFPFFLTLSNNPNYSDSPAKIEKHFFTLLRSYNGSINLGSVFYTARHFGWKPPFVPFWTINSGRVVFDYRKYIRFLTHNNFTKYFLNGENLICYIDGFFIKVVDGIFLKDFISSFIQNLPDYSGKNTKQGDFVLNAIIKNQYLFKPDTFEFLPSLDIALNSDTEKEAYFFFLNSYVKVTPKDILSLSYDTLDSYVFSDRVVQKKYTFSSQASDFEAFCLNICAHDSGRFDSLCSAIGFLLHNFKNPVDAKAIVFTDENFSDGAAGRSGKSLLAKSLSFLRNSVDIDGKNFSFNDPFAFQRVSATTSLVLFNDVDKSFPFEKLYNIISDSFVVQRKFLHEISIPFEKSPKVIITGNNTIRNSDPSAKARKFEIEFSSYYNIFRTPFSEFKKRFFDQWDVDDWNAFYTFMFRCVKFYLTYGLLEYSFVNLYQKKVMDGTTPEFFDFVSANLEFNVFTLKALFFEQFKESEPSFSDLKPQVFFKWLKYYASVYNYTYIEKRLGHPGVRHFSINKPESTLG
ncbi:MAG: bifunctional DNA primase/polymerase [Ignavibacteriaceae bacterium]